MAGRTDYIKLGQHDDHMSYHTNACQVDLLTMILVVIQ